MNHALVFIEKPSERIDYVLRFVLNKCLGISYTLCHDEHAFLQSDATLKISYGKQFDKGEYFWKQESNLLWEKNIEANSFENFIADYKEDHLTLSFLLLSRYQEYLFYTPDAHQRFPYRQDKIFQKIDVNQPFIDRWATKLADSIVQKHPTLPISRPKYESKITFDIDRLWKYKHAGLLHNWSRYGKNTLKQNTQEIASFKQFLRTKKDPYDVFPYVFSELQNTANKAIFFILLGDPSRFDKNLPYTQTQQKSFLKALAQKYPIGLHSSYASNDHPEKIVLEKQRLEKLIDQPITQNRQHYLRCNLPFTYRNLIACGIREDYSMGFAEIGGFKAGTSVDFPWFDLEKNESTSLQIFPFCVMDVSMKNYMKLSADEALNYVQGLRQTIRQNHGHFMPIFHNQNLESQGTWAPWRKVFEKSLKD